MTEIKVLSNTSQAVDIFALSEEERYFIIEQLMGPPAFVERYMIDDFAAMVGAAIVARNDKVVPKLLDLLVRGVLLRGEECGVIGVGAPLFGRDKSKCVVVQFEKNVKIIRSSGVEYVIPAGDSAVVEFVRVKVRGRGNDCEIRRKLLEGLKMADVANENGWFYGFEDRAVVKKVYDVKDAAAMERLFRYVTDVYRFSFYTARHVEDQVEVAIVGRKGPFVEALRELGVVVCADGARLEKEKPFLKELEAGGYGKFANVYVGALLADVKWRGMTKLWDMAEIRGPNDEEVQALLREFMSRRTMTEAYARFRKARAENETDIGTYRDIIKKRLGLKRLAEIDLKIMKAPATVAVAVGVLDLLGQDERKLVEIEYKKRKQYLEAVNNNKCEHVKLYRRFRQEKNEKSIKTLFDQLKLFFGESGSGMIVCNRCGFDLMCPHLRDFNEITGNDGNRKSALTKYVAKVKNADNRYYCRICGESMAVLDVFVEVSDGVVENMDEEFGSFLWREMASLVKYINVGETIANVNKLISAMRDTCYNYIADIDRQISKSKTSTTEETVSKLKLYSAIYGMAYIIRLIVLGSVTFRDMKINKPTVVDLIKHALGIIIVSRNIIIREIAGMTQDVIKNRLVEAYKMLKDAPTVVPISKINEAEHIIISVLLDPVYHYVYDMTAVNGYLEGESVTADRLDYVARLDEILGINVAKVTSGTDIYEKIVIPVLGNKWYKGEFDELVEGADKATREKARSGYAARCFEMFISVLVEDLCGKPMYVGDENVRVADEWKKFNEGRRELLKRERILRKQDAADIRKPFAQPPYSSSGRFKRVVVPLARLYDGNGKTHVWDIYLMAGGTEMPLKSIHKLLDEGKLFEGEIVGKKCSKCGIVWAECGAVTDESILGAIAASCEVSNFFRFYENRCPEGGLHDFGEDLAACGKCGMLIKFLQNVESPESGVYHKKYGKRYDKDKVDLGFSGVETRPVKPYGSEVEALDQSGWHFDFGKITHLANKVKVNFRLLSALGSVEKQAYADVESGEFIPPEVITRDNTRVYVVNTYIKNLVTEYNRLKFIYKILKPPAELLVLVDKSGMGRHKMQELATLLPDVYGQYNRKLEWMKANVSPQNVVLFSLESLCEMCIGILEDGVQETAKLRFAFVEYMVKKILRADELVTKPGAFNWSLLFGDKKKDDDGYRGDSGTESGSDSSDSENAAPLSMDAFDQEEPLGDDGEDENGVRAGDNLGM